MVDGAALADRLLRLRETDPVQHALVEAALAWALCGLTRPAPVRALLALAQDDAVPQLRGTDGAPVPPDHPQVQSALSRATSRTPDGTVLAEWATGPSGTGIVAVAALVDAAGRWQVNQQTFHRMRRFLEADELVPVGRRATREGFWYTAETILEDAVELRIRDAYSAIADIYHRQGFDSTADLWMRRMDREAPFSVAALIRQGMLPAELQHPPPPGHRPEGIPLSELRVRPSGEDDRR